jgi:pimeloyl-ACP methyl ester carboxylesterase
MRAGQGGWQNRILARLVNELSRYNPVWSVPAIQAPVLMVVATKDELCPLEVARRAAAGNPRLRLVEKHAGHFDVYVGELFKEVAAEQAKFFLEAMEAPARVVEPTEALPLL